MQQWQVALPLCLSASTTSTKAAATLTTPSMCKPDMLHHPRCMVHPSDQGVKQNE